MFFVDSANFVSMKRLFLSLLACLLFACLAEAQRTHDTIYLKNGSVLYGQIIEELPDTQVKIRLRDGSLLVSSTPRGELPSMKSLVRLISTGILMRGTFSALLSASMLGRS